MKKNSSQNNVEEQVGEKNVNFRLENRLFLKIKRLSQGKYDGRYCRLLRELIENLPEKKLS